VLRVKRAHRDLLVFRATSETKVLKAIRENKESRVYKETLVIKVSKVVKVFKVLLAFKVTLVIKVLRETLVHRV
jgi:hypothetical protein